VLIDAAGRSPELRSSDLDRKNAHFSLANLTTHAVHPDEVTVLAAHSAQEKHTHGGTRRVEWTDPGHRHRHAWGVSDGREGAASSHGNPLATARIAEWLALIDPASAAGRSAAGRVCDRSTHVSAP
jgi:hypothetical protein